MLLDPVNVVVTTLFLGFFSHLGIVLWSRKSVELRRISPLLLGSLLGIPLGAWIITITPQPVLKILIGAVIIAFAVPAALGIHRTVHHERLGGGLAGFLSGILASSTSLGGPPVVLFMHGQRWPKQTIHPSLATYFLWITAFSLIALGVSRQVHAGAIVTAASLLPAMLIGIIAGMRTFYKTDSRLFRQLTIAVVIGAGALAILSGAGILPG
jgi:uncharacterized membrane protein YfcA